MKLIHATSYFLLAAGAAASESSPLPSERNPHSKAIAGLRELQKLAGGKDRSLLVDAFSGFDFATGLDCGGACGDADKCTSFMGPSPDASTLEASCDAGCIPQVALSTCDQLCGDDDDAPAISVQRINLFGSAVELVCGNCKFYECCVDDDSSYESCEGTLPDVDFDSLLPNNPGGSSGIGSLLPGLGNPPGIGSLLPDLEDLPDLNALIDGLPDIGSIVPWGSVSSSSDSDGASGLSVLGQMVGSSLECPETCGEPELCQSAFLAMGGAAGDQTLQDACNKGCLPIAYSPSCAEICGNVNVPKFMGSVVGMACDSCKFIECCTGNQEVEGEKFEACEGLLPTMDDLLPDIDWETIHAAEWNSTWGSGLDWSGIDMASGLSDLVENIHSLFDQALGDFDAFPVSCNSETCPIDGLCEMGIVHLSNMNFEDACNNSTFFKCTDGLEEMCANECDGAESDPFLSASFCSLCNIATCCKNKDDETSFQDCALEALPQEINDVIGGFASVMENVTDLVMGAFDDLNGIEDVEESQLNGNIADVPVELAPSEPSGDQGTPADNYDTEPVDAPGVVETLDSSQQDIAIEDSSGDPAIASVEPAPESSESLGAPAEESAIEPLDPSAAAVIEVSRYESAVDSGSQASQSSAFLAVASIATIAFVLI